MKRILKSLHLNLFTWIEIIFVFIVIIVVISLNLGYKIQIKTDTTLIDSYGILTMLNAITILAVIVTALGIMGIQLIQVYRRSNEIGLCRAIGAKDIDIIRLIFKNTLFFILLPAMCGVIIGLVLLITMPFGKIGLQDCINLQLIFGCVAVILLLTMISGMFPVWRAVRINPIEVLNKRAARGRVNSSKIGKLIFYIIAVGIIVIGTIINYTKEIEFKEDLMNTEGAPPASSEKVPYFEIKDAKGNIISSETLLGTRYCLLLWEMDCPYGSIVLEELSHLVDEGILKKEEVFAVSIDQSYHKIKKYLQFKNLSINRYVDRNKSTKWAFHVMKVPAVYLIDNEGMITARVLGWSEGNKDYLINHINGME
ncbi:MAG: hypothetical protein K0S47_708 [Herbinix sp.]|jgi:hypothetical protein|nr:hypothetical protein [Herbinix sp.]